MKVLLVDDHILFRAGLSSLLARFPNIHIVGTAESIAETVAKTQKLEPDVILMNFYLSDGTGLEATQAILAKHPATNIVFLTTCDKDERLFEALRFGAVGYLNKSTSLNKILKYIRGLEVDDQAATEPVLNN